jgi:hypothetical protein
MLLAARLPRGHPVREATAGGTRLTAPPADLAGIAEVLLSLPDLSADLRPAPSWPGAAVSSPGPADVEAWLRVTPALTERQVRDRGGDPGRGDLIRLVQAAGQTQLPAFQFGPDGQPIAVVARINRLLGADEDPYGVADWWLGRNAWLNAIPAELIGQVEDDILVSAARAELTEV